MIITPPNFNDSKFLDLLSDTELSLEIKLYVKNGNSTIKTRGRKNIKKSESIDIFTLSLGEDIKNGFTKSLKVSFTPQISLKCLGPGPSPDDLLTPCPGPSIPDNEFEIKIGKYNYIVTDNEKFDKIIETDDINDLNFILNDTNIR